jgi:hypothetical protein
VSEIIPDDITLTARLVTEGIDGWIGSLVGMQIISRAILAERKRCAHAAASILVTSNALAVDEVDNVGAAIMGGA